MLRETKSKLLIMGHFFKLKAGATNIFGNFLRGG